jgi:CheY-like chemotaxis protein
LKTASTKSTQPRVLLVDDNDELRKAIGAVLGASKFRVTTAANTAEALHLASVTFAEPGAIFEIMEVQDGEN